MIAKTYIEANLKGIQRRFDNARTQKEPLYYSKLAILELCGWIEVSIDDLICRCVRRRVKDTIVMENFEKNVIKPVYGFHYSKHFRKMLCSALGEITVHDIENSIDQLKRQQLNE